MQSLVSKARRYGKRASRTYKKWLSALAPFQPMQGGRELLDAEYARGVWDYLRNVEEAPRLSIVAGYCHYFKEHGTLLEIGCGEGVLQERLDAARYSRYVGVDISGEAIQRASIKQNERISFVQADAQDYIPDQCFDAIIFNECLEYFADPVGLVQRYERFLRQDGIFIVSMFVGLDTVRTKRIWKRLQPAYKTIANAKVTTEPGYSWIIRILKPIRSRDEAERA